MDCLRASDGPADQHSLDLTPPASKSSGWLRITRPQRSTVGRAWSPAAVVPDQPNVVAARRDRPDTAGYGRSVPGLGSGCTCPSSRTASGRAHAQGTAPYSQLLSACPGGRLVTVGCVG